MKCPHCHQTVTRYVVHTGGRITHKGCVRKIVRWDLPTLDDLMWKRLQAAMEQAKNPQPANQRTTFPCPSTPA